MYNKALAQELTNPGNREGEEGWLLQVEKCSKKGTAFCRHRGKWCRAGYGYYGKNFSDASKQK